ncbi:MAG: hypothetical protein EXS13_03975 [Planctomycetes bacterium]|nr:hypothetical protein [Planctomycetota bacterium]
MQLLICAALQFATLAASSDDSAPARVREIPPVLAVEVAKLHRALIPKRDEPWQTIPWQVDLLAAREEAIRTKRPLFLWAMNGHPLGCV